MKVTLIGNKEIYSIVLPQNPVGNYWISDNKSEIEKKLINIEGKDGKWKIITNDKVKVIDPNAIDIVNNGIRLKSKEKYEVNSAILKEYYIYGLFIGNMNNFYIVYCSPVYEDYFYHLDIREKSSAIEIFIGKSDKAEIKYNNALVSDIHCKIYKKNDNWYIKNYDRKFGTFVNNKLVYDEEKKLNNGDLIYILGLKIVLIGDGFYVNNPLDNVKIDQNCFVNTVIKAEEINTYEDESLDNVSLFNESDYFFKIPRLKKIIHQENIRIDPPPQKQNSDEMPLILVLGSSLSMGSLMIFSSLNSMINSNSETNKISIYKIIYIIVMLISIIMIPFLTTKWQRKRKEKYEKKRQEKYRIYIETKIKEINEIMDNQRNMLLSNYSSANECKEIIQNKYQRLWDRNADDFDFLDVRLGIGDVPLNININYPEQGFTVEEDALLDVMDKITKLSRILKQAPITFSFKDNNVSAIIYDNVDILDNMMKSIITQLVTFQSYSDLKLVFLLKEDKERKWEYVKKLPHIWNDTKDIRFFGDNVKDIDEISKYLEEIYRDRNTEDTNKKSLKTPYYLIITDDYKSIKNLKIINEVINLDNKNLGFGLLCLGKNLSNCATQTNVFIKLNNENGMIIKSEITDDSLKEFKIEKIDDENIDKAFSRLLNIPIKYTYSSKEILSNKYTFLELFDVGLVEQLNILERWNKNDTTLSLSAPIGIDNSGRKIDLDIHEKYHGPHGLIAGSTGSGKSEFIITYILSLAVNYHPNDLAFVLIDYKGGGLAGAFQKKNMELPHLVGTITNIDKVGLQRSLASIKSELNRRQIMFNEARNKTDESTIDIYKYQKLYHDGIVKEPIPHLLIICDEFAELKQQQSSFMEELISVARIGRSLGVHLILATQKPSGVVNEEIRSNSKFSICLKVQTKELSRDVIDTPDAAGLKEQGQFYLKVGNDEYYNMGYSGYTGAPYIPSAIIRKSVDKSVEFISNIGNTIKRIDNKVEKVRDADGEQITRVLEYLNVLAKNEQIERKQLWLENIPENIYVDNLRKKYNVKDKPNVISPVIGEYDAPQIQKQFIAKLDLSSNGNTLIYGNAESGKESLLNTICYDLMEHHTPDEISIYILDFGSESFKVLRNAPHVGDVIFSSENEKIERFFGVLQNEIKNRKKILADYNGSYKLYLEKNKNPLPMILVIINNYAIFEEVYDKYEETLMSIVRDSSRWGITFICTVSAGNDIRYRMGQNFKQKIVLRMNNDDDYKSILDNRENVRPSDLFGRGLIKVEGKVYEYQLAKMCDAEEYNSFIKETIKNLNDKYSDNRAEIIKTMPEYIKLGDIIRGSIDINNFPIGISKVNLTTIEYNLQSGLMHLILSKSMNDVLMFMDNILDAIKKMKNTNIDIFDFGHLIINENTNLYENVKERILNNSSSKNNLIIIIGIDKFLSNIENSEKEFLEFLTKVDELKNCNFIIVDSVSKIKQHEYDKWYKSYVSGDDGIWVGSGFDDQYLLNTMSRKGIVNNCGRTFGYVVKKGNLTPIKLLGMKEEDEDNG